MNRPPVGRSWMATLVVLAATSAWATPETWYLLTRDGVLHALSDGTDAPVARQLGESRDLVAVDGRDGGREGGRWAVLGKDAISLVTATQPPQKMPGHADDLAQLVGGAGRLFASVRSGDVVEIAVKTGARTVLGHFTRPLIVFDGKGLLVAHDGVIEELGGKPRKWTVVGRPIALAATKDQIFCATREGPLWQIDRQKNSQHDIGLGGWWGTLALDIHDGHLVVATVAGKLWRIDLGATPTKTPVANEGWAATVGLVAR